MLEVPWKQEAETLPLIKIVGTSAAGKSTLVRTLREAGYNAQPVSQEHSHVPTLWQQFKPPARLIYLEINLEGQQHRRPDVTWDRKALRAEQERLAHAREHADLRINTSEMDAAGVLRLALTYLQHERIRHADEPLPPVTATGTLRQNRSLPSSPNNE